MAHWVGLSGQMFVGLIENLFTILSLWFSVSQASEENAENRPGLYQGDKARAHHGD